MQLRVMHGNNSSKLYDAVIIMCVALNKMAEKNIDFSFILVLFLRCLSSWIKLLFLTR